MMIFGDLNFRIDMENAKCRQMIKNEELSSLQTYDQFIIEKKKNSNFADIVEGKLNFRPTYRYDINTNDYDTSKKNRVPAWCDRVLWRYNDIINQMLYERADYKMSDHRPVYSFFEINLFKNSNFDFSIKSEIQNTEKEVKIYLILEISSKMLYN